MRKSTVISTSFLCLFALALAGFPCRAQSSDSGKSALLVYKPPLRGAPAGGGRIAAAVRGKGSSGPTLIALAPNDIGAVSRPQPVIYWYVSGASKCHVSFTINDEMHQDTLVDTELPSPGQAGTYAIRLADYNVKLSPGVVYKWFVTLQVDPSQPSKDVYSGGNIMYTAPSPDLASKVQAASAGHLPALYAQNGFWYDAFDAAWATGKNGVPREFRVSLLKQVNFGVPDPGKDPVTLAGEKALLRFVAR